MITQEEIDILSDRYVSKMTFRELGTKYNKSHERMRQKLENILGILLFDFNAERWKEQKGIANIENQELMQLMYLIGEHNKLTILINDYKIKQPADFLAMLPNDFLHRKNIGKKFFLKLKLALLKLGYPYNEETFEELEIQLAQQKKNNSLSVRFKILKRDNFTCQYCGKSPRNDSKIILQIDHIIPVSKNGSWEENNLITACRECNLGKGNRH